MHACTLQGYLAYHEALHATGLPFGSNFTSQSLDFHIWQVLATAEPQVPPSLFLGARPPCFQSLIT